MLAPDLDKREDVSKWTSVEDGTLGKEDVLNQGWTCAKILKPRGACQSLETVVCTLSVWLERRFQSRAGVGMLRKALEG